MAETIKTSGFRELAAGLAEFKKATERTVLRRVATKALQPFVERAKALAPVDEGYLRESIVIGSNLTRTAKTYDRTEPRNGVRMFAGTADRNGVPREFGAIRDGKLIRPRPFMRPAWDATSPGMIEDVRAQLAIEIQRTAARIAKRGAK